MEITSAEPGTKASPYKLAGGLCPAKCEVPTKAQPNHTEETPTRTRIRTASAHSAACFAIIADRPFREPERRKCKAVGHSALARDSECGPLTLAVCQCAHSGCGPEAHRTNRPHELE